MGDKFYSNSTQLFFQKLAFIFTQTIAGNFLKIQGGVKDYLIMLYGLILLPIVVIVSSQEKSMEISFVTVGPIYFQFFFNKCDASVMYNFKGY